MEDSVALYVFGLVILEYFELSWQKGNTLKELLAFNYMVYQYGMFYYFFKHTAFLYIIFTIIHTNIINSFTLTLVIMKFIDIGFKLYVIGKINQKGDLYMTTLFDNQDIPLSMYARYSNIVIYPVLLYLGLSNGFY